MASRVTSVFLYVRDVGRSLEFYNEVVGAEIKEVHALQAVHAAHSTYTTAAKSRRRRHHNCRRTLFAFDVKWLLTQNKPIWEELAEIIQQPLTFYSELAKLTMFLNVRFPLTWVNNLRDFLQFNA